MLSPSRSDSELALVLDRFLEGSDPEALAAADPVALVRRYPNPADREVAGLFVAMMAYGRVATIKAKAGALLDRLGPEPARAIDRGEGRVLAGFVHRFQRGRDFSRFAEAIRVVRARHGSLGAAFAAGAPEAEADYVLAMGRFITTLTAGLSPRPSPPGSVRGPSVGREAAVNGLRPPLSPGLRFLLPSVGAGGAAKRLCLYLRWMIRPAGPVDTGAWQVLAPGLSAAKLIIPLDTHIERIGRYLGLTDRRSGGLATAVEITRALRRLRPEDPLAYDLALCHLGISGRCPSRRDLERCADCQIRAVCRLGAEPEAWPHHPSPSIGKPRPVR